uniref:Protein aurora borealis n=1 Tax=Phallusia mammillata TaxID=59560 RepID=A0A6F9D8I0_9ASCI|nr:protein aurora borealis-like [Phallusia mammillata]
MDTKNLKEICQPAKKINELTPKCKNSSSATSSSLGLKHASPFIPKTTDSSCHCNQHNESDVSIINPFENHITLDSLHQPSFSPSVFKSSNQDSSELCPKTPQSFWTIDQIAIMKPVDIDVSQLHQQQDCIRLDYGTEIKAQKAIDDFFANHVHMSSPSPHYLAIISPSVSYVKKKAESQSPCNYLASPKINRRSLNQFHTQPKAAASSTDVATQTTLSFPWNVDVETLLKKYSLHSQTNTAPVEGLTTSSLRRKLFFQENVEDTDDSEWYPCLSDPEPTHQISSSSTVGHHLSFSGSVDNCKRPIINEELSPHASPIYPVRNIFSNSHQRVFDESAVMPDISPIRNSPFTNPKCFCASEDTVGNPNLSPIQPIERTETDEPFESTLATKSPLTEKDVT